MVTKDNYLTAYLLEGIWIPFETLPDSLLTVILVFQVIKAIFAITIATKFASSETIAIQLQALGLCTVTSTFLFI